MSVKERIKQELTEWTTWVAMLIVVMYFINEPFWVDVFVVMGLILWSPTRAEAFIARWAPKLQRGVDKAGEVVEEIKNS